jgi:hypothetical protein
MRATRGGRGLKSGTQISYVSVYTDQQKLGEPGHSDTAARAWSVQQKKHLVRKNIGYLCDRIMQTFLTYSSMTRP